jgi:secretory phospholipase A2
MEVRNVNHRQLRQAIEQCHQQYSVSYPGTRTGAFDFIYPGTRWCGPGDVAAHYHDLGFHTDVDACCRAHDHCFDIIPSQSCKHGLCNNSPFTMYVPKLRV